VGQGVDAAVGGNFRRTGYGEERIDHGGFGSQEIAQYTDLDLIFRIRKYGGGGNFRTRSRRGRNTNERMNGPRNPVIANVVLRIAAVGKDYGSNLGEVHIATAAQAENNVRVALAGVFYASSGSSEGRFRLATGKYVDGNRSFLQR